MSTGIALAQAKVTGPDGAVRYEGVQVMVRGGQMRISGKGIRTTEPDVTAVEQVRPSVWSVTFGDGTVLGVERLVRRCGTCGGSR